MDCMACDYQWTPRKESPKQCPRCHNYLEIFTVKKVAERRRLRAAAKTRDAERRYVQALVDKGVKLTPEQEEVLKEFRSYKNMPQDSEYDRALLEEAK